MTVAHLAQKQGKIEEIRDRFSRAVASVLIDFRGLDVQSTTDLRDRFRAAGVDYRVVKNTLVEKAIEGLPVADVLAGTEFLKGPTAVAWSYEDPSAAAKIIKAFRKDLGDKADKINVKCGVLERELFKGEQVETQLASLPGKDEIRAQLLAQLLAPAQSLVRQLAAPAQNLAYALDARARQLGE